MMWSVARFDLGLAEPEFWRLTPRQYVALLARWERREEMANARAGLRPADDDGEEYMDQDDWDAMAEEYAARQAEAGLSA